MTASEMKVMIQGAGLCEVLATMKEGDVAVVKLPIFPALGAEPTEVELLEVAKLSPITTRYTVVFRWRGVFLAQTVINGVTKEAVNG